MYIFETNDNIVVYVKRRISGICSHVCVCRYSVLPRKQRDLWTLYALSYNHSPLSRRALTHTQTTKDDVEIVFVFFQLRWQYHWRNFFPVFKGLFGLPIITVIGYLSIFGILIFKNTGVTASFSNYRKYHTSANTEVRYFCMFKTTLFSSHVRHGYLCITLSLSYFWNCFSMVNIYWCIMLHC